jgi:hypothetical protein
MFLNMINGMKQKDIGKMQPIFRQSDNDENLISDFQVFVYQDNDVFPGQIDYKKELENSLENKPIFKILNGRYCEKDALITFDINGIEKKLPLNSNEIRQLKMYKRKFFDKDVDWLYKTDCGDFQFQFYIYDFDAESDSKYYLDKATKDIIKGHRIYLYRDGIRVYPYGDIEDDWLQIDTFRGTISAGAFLSNDQVMGCVYITDKVNPKLKDKTNREGLIEDGGALFDFTTVLQFILEYIKCNPYQKYRIDKQKRKEHKEINSNKSQTILNDVKKSLVNDKNSLQLLEKFEKSYKNEKQVFEDRIKKTENLAAVGLSVETASHDVMLLLKKSIEQLDNLSMSLMKPGEADKNIIYESISSIRGTIGFVEKQMTDIQLLFPSTKSKTKNIRVKEILEKVIRLYHKAFNDNNIDCEVFENGNPIIARTTDAVLLQVFINLFDNALYWLKLISSSRKVNIYLEGNDNRVIFCDNGPGINSDDLPYIFDAFFSGKGEEGRGLGLYIARQLLDRYDYTITTAEFKKDIKLPGANFIIEFVKE